MPRKSTKSNFIQLVILGLLIILIPISFYGFMQVKYPYSAAKVDKTGNGARSGQHFNLNIIGVPKNKTADMTNAGHRIFVPLEGNAKINLMEGEDFQVIDANATDGPATFQLPNPDPDNDGVTKYSVWARPLGKPGGKSTTTTCAYDELMVEWCSTEAMVLVREQGGSKFSNVSKQLLYVYVDLNADGSLERYPLFDSALQDYFWGYDNQGMKLVQLRFYEVMTDVN